MFNKLLKRTSEFLARLVVLNFVLQLLPDWPVVGWLVHSHLFLHLGVILGLLGMLLGEVL